MEDFTIKEKFEFLNNYLDLVRLGNINSLIISGTSGIGKSFEVKKFISEHQLNVSYIKGFSTARALYDELYHNRNSFIVFDDCDSILEDKVAINILKGALDSYEDRIISWLSKSRDTSIPNQFNFQGQVVFISNLTMEKFDKAMKSRALTIDLTMDFQDKIDRMGNILEDIGKKEMPFYEKYDILEFLIENAKNENDVNLRTLEKGLIFFTNDKENWKRQFKFYLSTSN